MDVFRQMFCKTEDLDDWHFSTLHRITLGLDGKDLSNHIQMCSKTELNRKDVRGMTGLN